MVLDFFSMILLLGEDNIEAYGPKEIFLPKDIEKVLASKIEPK